jgi:hypothetical protein
MTEFMSDLVSYHPTNPDPEHGCCRNTGEEGVDGVVFSGIEPVEGTYCFVGRQSILEAFALLFGVKPNEIKKFLKANDLLKEERASIKAMQAKLDAIDQFVVRAESAGIFVKLLED